LLRSRTKHSQWHTLEGVGLAYPFGYQVRPPHDRAGLMPLMELRIGPDRLSTAAHFPRCAALLFLAISARLYAGLT